jgi:phosphate:Na+ symporter
MLPMIHRLAEFLTRKMQDVDRRGAFTLHPGGHELRHNISRATRLNEAALEFPAVAFKVLRFEIDNLGSRIKQLVCYGLYLDHKGVFDGKSLEVLCSRTRLDDYPEDFDQLYQIHVKGVYGDITTFIALAQRSMNTDQMELAFSLRQACNQWVLALKAVKHLRKNLSLHLGGLGEDRKLKQQYNRLRMLIAEVLIALHQVSIDSEIDRVMAFDSVRVLVEQGNLLNDGTIDRLIQEERFGGDLVSSLINDNNYAQMVCLNLIRADELIINAIYSDDTGIVDLLRLEEEDLQQLAHRDISAKD